MCNSCRGCCHISEICSGQSISEARATVLKKFLYFCEEFKDAYKNVPVMVRRIAKMEEEIQQLKPKISTLEEEKSTNAESTVYVSQRAVIPQNFMIHNHYSMT